MRPFSRLVFVLALTALSLAPTLALAKDPPVWSEVNVAVHSEESGGLMIVSGELPETTKLPAEVKLSAPPAHRSVGGRNPRWRRLGRPTVKYEVATEGDSDVYSFTLAQSRIGQIEVLAPSVATQTATGGTRRLQLDRAGGGQEARFERAGTPGREANRTG